jgi:hypothetical protein
MTLSPILTAGSHACPYKEPAWLPRLRESAFFTFTYLRRFCSKKVYMGMGERQGGLLGKGA